MAKVVTTSYVDDFDEQKLAENEIDDIEFSYRGKDYTLQLRPSNAAQMDQDMAKYIEAAVRAQQRSANGSVSEAPTSTVKSRASRVKPTRGRAGRKSARNKALDAGALTPAERKAVREWANANGHNVSTRGRLPADVIEAFNAAQ